MAFLPVHPAMTIARVPHRGHESGIETLGSRVAKPLTAYKDMANVRLGRIPEPSIMPARRRSLMRGAK